MAIWKRKIECANTNSYKKFVGRNFLKNFFFANMV